MRRVAVLLALGAVLPARADGLASLDEEQAALYDRIAPGVVVVSAGRALGAGFAVAPGLVLTAGHVVAGAGAVEVVLRDGRSLRGEVVERAAGGLDLALLRIAAEPPPLPLAPSARLRPGSVVATVGHPDGNRFTLATGVVAQAAADGPDPALVRLQLPLRPGASGAPVVDRSGRVVGVVALGASGAVTFAIRTEAAFAALAGLRGVAGAAHPPAPSAARIGGEDGAMPLSTAAAEPPGDARDVDEAAPPVEAPVLETAPALQPPALVTEVPVRRARPAARPAAAVARNRSGRSLAPAASHRAAPGDVRAPLPPPLSALPAPAPEAGAAGSTALAAAALLVGVSGIGAFALLLGVAAGAWFRRGVAGR